MDEMDKTILVNIVVFVSIGFIIWQWSTHIFSTTEATLMGSNQPHKNFNLCTQLSAGHGMHNSKNDCYLNAIVQCIRFTPYFMRDLAIRLNELQVKGQVAEGLVRLVEQLNTSSKVVDNRPFVNRCRQFLSPVVNSSDEQQDAQEFLSLLLNRVHDEMAVDGVVMSAEELAKEEWRKIQWRQALYSSKLESDMDFNRLIVELGKLEWRSGNRKDSSVVSAHFEGQMVRGFYCTSCHKVSYNHQRVKMLAVELVGDGCTVEECMEQYSRVENMEDDNRIVCPVDCGVKTDCQTQVLFHRLPDCFIIQLKRFKLGYWSSCKVDTKVHYPTIELDVTPLMFDKTDKRNCFYNLYAVCAHLGSTLDGGHYVAYARWLEVGDDALWYKFNDDHVETISTAQMLLETQSTAYLLFYKKCNILAKS